MSEASRIAVLYSGDATDPTSWSGVPNGLVRGLRGCGCEVVPVNAALPKRVDNTAGRSMALQPAYSSIKSVLARYRLSQLRPRPDGVLQIGSDFTLRTDVPLATYEDMTVIQHERYGDEWFLSHPARVRAAWRARQGAVYRSATVCTVMSQWAAESIVADYQISPGKVAVVGCGIDVVPSSAHKRDWSAPRFLVIARDWRRKNVPAVVETFAAVREQFPAAVLDIVGPYPGPGGDGIHLHGSKRMSNDSDREDMERLIGTATCFVMPSVHEAFGKAYVEAGAAGLPSIGTSVGGAPEAIGDGGITVDPDDRDQLRSAMLAMCDGHAAARLGELARAHAATFRWERVAGDIVRYLGIASA